MAHAHDLVHVHETKADLSGRYSNYMTCMKFESVQIRIKLLCYKTVKGTISVYILEIPVLVVILDRQIGQIGL